MGKEWFYWGGGGGGSSGGRTSAATTKKGKQSRKQLEIIRGNSNESADNSGPAPGCMCSVFQIFDLPYLPFVLNHHHHHHHHNPSVSSSVQDDNHNGPTKGVEAPRNSLELSTLKQQEEDEARNLNNVSVGINQIRTSCDSRPSTCKTRADDFSSECSGSPGGAKTPSLVARLMGLDLLPENEGSPAFAPGQRKSNLHPKPDPSPSHDRARNLLQERGSSRRFNVLDNADLSRGTRSLPETPRISLARKSDVDHHHRLSLQMNKENVVEEMLFDTGKRATRNRKRRSEQYREVLKQVDENISRSPSYYARQIVKQVKESVSRKVGVDVTNTILTNNNKNKHHRHRLRDDDTQVVLLKPNKPSIILEDDNDEHFGPNKQQSCSPRLRFLELKTAKLHENTTTPPVIPKPQKVSDLNPKPKTQENHYSTSCATQKLPRPSPSADIIRSKKEEPFIVRPVNTNLETKKSKRATPLSSELLNPNNVPSILPASLKKDRPSPTKLHQNKQTSQLSSSPSRPYKQPPKTPTTTAAARDTHAPPCGSADAEFQYVQRILKRSGIEKDSLVSSVKWYSDSHPLDPAIFHYIELFHHHLAAGTPPEPKLRLRCNRKLIFQLVDEILGGILKTKARSSRQHHLTGSELARTICRKIQSFPAADCKVLEDIDALIDSDLEKSKNGSLLGDDEEEEEEEGIVFEIEREIFDSLLHEMAAATMVVRPLAPPPSYSGRRALV